MTTQIDIAANLARVREQMATAATRVGRSPADITLVAVSKTHPESLIHRALAAGQADFGENLVEEAWAKFVDPANPAAISHTAPASDVRLHLIGPIQSRKAALAIACRPALIHAVDRLKIAQRLDRFAVQAGLAQVDVLLEVNVAGEASKFGYTPDGVWRDVEALLALPRVRIHGLMTVPPFAADPEDVRPHFATLRTLRDRLAAHWPEADWHHLSMGMSNDFTVAIEEGATIVRVGTAIFGAR